MNQPNLQNTARKTLTMPFKRNDEDEYGQSYLAMLDAIRRYYERTGDPFVKPIIENAERALRRR